ncbi:hypothetical protein VI817_003914 [Penicillium citrinum]|nr:hypothetical protein VI817_003914 [Penicillium citrinum]
MEEPRILTPPEGEIFMVPDNDNGLAFWNPPRSGSSSSTAGFLGNVRPVGEDMIRIDSESSAGTDAIPRVGIVAPYSQARTERAKTELQKAVAEVDELNPARDGPLTLTQIGRWADRNIIQGARGRNRAGPDPNDSWIDPEYLRKARHGPGTEINDRIYRKLAHPRLAAKTEEPQIRTFCSLEFAQDDGTSEMTLNDNWKRKRIGTPEYHGQWTAYQASPPLYPRVKDGILQLASASLGCIYDHQSLPSKVENPASCEQHEFRPRWEYYPKDHWNPEGARERFFSWLQKIPTPGLAVDIYHAAFFDGTSCPDGGSSMMIMRENHGATPRHENDEQTRLHWHETAAGYVWNIRSQMKAKTKEAIRESQRELALRGTLQPSTQRQHSYLILRPGEFTDVEELVPLFNWYAEHTTFLPDETPITKVKVNRIIQACRDQNMPFIVAVPDRTVEVLEKRPDDPEISGLAYVKKFNDERSTGEIRVFVHPKSKRLQIGTALVDMILRSCDSKQSPEGHRPYDFRGRDRLEYGNGCPCKLHQLVCAIAYEPKKAKDYIWVKQWLIKRFRFEALGNIQNGRVKFGHRYVYVVHHPD